MGADFSFGISFLQAVNDWQRGGQREVKRRRSARLKVACATLPAHLRQADSICFRQIALDKKSVWDLLGEGALDEEVSAWTTDITLAKAFKGGVPPETQGFQGVIFALKPVPSQVIVNLEALYQDEAFLRSLEQHKKKVAGFYEGAGRYGSAQSEVVLEVVALVETNIYSLGGWSSSFSDLVRMAAWQIYGRAPSEAEFAELYSRVRALESEAGVEWLDPESTQGVLARTRPHAADLRVVKRIQDALRKKPTP